MASGDRNGPDGAGGGALEVSIGRLPHTGAQLFGRERELTWLDRCWEGGASAVSIVAWGGVGKSALVNAWLRGMQRDGWRGAERVYGWSFYSQGTTDRITSADEFVSAALRWFGDGDPTVGSPWDKGERLAGLVRKQRALLVLDGLEPLQWGPGPEEGKIKDPALQALVRELGAQNKGLCVITSRIGLRDLEDYAGEKSQERKLEHLSAEAGAKLLTSRGAKGTEAELRQATEEVGGHGLALTLLGSYLDEACEGDVRRRHEIGPLAGDERLGEQARRVMVAYERWFQGGPELSVLRMLGLFDRPAGEGEIAALRAPPAIAGLTDALAGLGEQKWNKAVARLRRVGLLAEETGGRQQQKGLDAHPLVREHFGEQLRREQPEAWREGHGRLYEHLKRTAKELPETIEEMAPLYAAVLHGCRAGRRQGALVEVFIQRIQREIEWFNSTKLGAFGAEVAILSAFFDHPWGRLSADLSHQSQIYVLFQTCLALRALGRLPEAEAVTRLSLEKSSTWKDWMNAAIAASDLSELFLVRGDLTEALAHARKSVELADKSGHAFQRKDTRATLADVLHQMGRLAEAALQFEAAERLQRDWEPTYPLLYSLRGFQYCDLLLHQGQEAEVLERAARMLTWDKEQHWLLAIALDHLSLGRAHLLQARHSDGGDLAQAAALLKDAIEGLRAAGIQECIPLSLLARADLHSFTGDLPRAQRDLAEALSLATRCGFRLHEADAHLGYARLHLAAGDLALAHQSLARARALIEATGYHRRDEELARLEALTTDKPHNAPASAKPEPAPEPAPEPRIPQPARAELPVDFLIITALEEERDAVLEKLPGYQKLDRDGADTHTYFEAELLTKRRDKTAYRVLITSLSGMGPIQGAIKAGAAIKRWRPDHVLVVGIAGGVAGEAELGDVLLASDVADYTLGKIHGDGRREERWKAFPADANLFDAANNFSAGWEDLVKLERPAPGLPRRRTGVIASGGDVIASRNQIESYRADWPKLIGVEMEGGGVAAGLHHDIARPRFLMIRGVSDLADGEDNAATKKRWRAYACEVAAAYAIGLLRDGPVPSARQRAR